MSMIPFFPTLRPSIASNLWFDVDIPCDDDSDVTNLETEHQNWLNGISQIAFDLHPLGKSNQQELSNDSDQDDDDDANESESEEELEEESHDEEVEEERDDDEMNNTTYSPTEMREAANNDNH